MFLRVLLLWLAAAMAGACVAAPPDPAGPVLDAAERDWVARHPTVRVGVSTEFPPYYFAAAQGRYEGFVIELMQRLAERTGLQLEYRHFDRFGDVLAAMRAGEVDVTPFTSQSPERERYLHFVHPLFATQLVLVADRRAADVSAALFEDPRLGGKRIAVERLSTAAELLRRRYPQAALQEFDSSEAALLAAAAGEADLFVGFRQVAVYHMEKHLTANLALRGAVVAAGTSLGPAVRRDLPELASVLDKAVATLGTDEIALLAAKWLPRSLLSEAPRPAIDLTPAQRQWIASHAGPRFGFDAAFAPIAFTNAAGGFDGLAADITRLLAAKSGLVLAYARGGSFADVYDSARRGELDVIVAAARNAEREREFDFVGPFLRVPTVVVAAADGGFLRGLETPGAHRLALLRGHFLRPQLHSRHPGLVFVERDTQAEVLEALRGGAADLAIGNMKVVNALLEARHAGALQTVGIVPQGDSELYFAVRKGLPELAPILRAALDATAPSELGALEGRWLRTQVEIGLPWPQVLAYGAAALLLAGAVIGALWWSNRRLRDAQRTLQQARDASEAQVAARARFSAYLSHELRGALGGLAGGLDLIESGSLPREGAGRLVAAMRRSASGLLELCERTLDFERLLQGGADIQPRPVLLLDAIEGAIAPWRVQADLKGLALVLDCRFDPAVRANCDAIRLGQVIQNLVGNAVKFTARGRVELRAMLQPGDGGTHRLRLEVADSGPGVPEAEQAHLFAAFAQGDAGRRAGQGAGLGLSIATRIVELMGGTLRLASSSAAGSVFAAELPIELLPAAPQVLAAPAAAA
ncbi:MAG: transporter substrate-binding domain-containing protein [Piscinibacter sp.]|nr:transporter substrate-binding domain-containing protein [Piscinibacter sp.]